MKRRAEDINSRIILVPLHPDEYAVCQILSHLPRLIAESDSPHKLPFSWGAKRRRSAMESAPPFNRLFSSPQFLHPSMSFTPPATTKAGGSSPSTPLSFSPSESDEKPSTSKYLQKQNEEGLATVNELTQRRELLKMESENEKRHYERLKAFNAELITRTRKEEAPEPRSEETHCVIGNSNPLGIPDLNEPAEETIWMDHLEAIMVDSAAANANKAVAAEARQRRMQIYRMNKTGTAMAIKFR